MDSADHMHLVELDARSKKKTGYLSYVTLSAKVGVYLRKVQQSTTAENVLIL